jgi:hypothetical protein
MTADSDAFAIVEQLQLTPAERQYMLAVARGEGFYGLGWGNPSALTIAKSEEFGIDPRAGVGSNNWGAEQGQGSAGSFPHVDSRSDGTFFVGQYKRHSTPALGAASVARVLLKPNVKEAIKTGFYPGPIIRFLNPTPAQKKQLEYKKQFSGQNIGPLKAAVLSQSDNGYYELHPEQYLKAVTRNYDILTAALKWPPLLRQQPLIPGTMGTIAATPLVGSLSSESGESSGTELPEAGFLRGQLFSVPGIQDEPKK